MPHLILSLDDDKMHLRCARTMTQHRVHAEPGKQAVWAWNNMGLACPVETVSAAFSTGRGQLPELPASIIVSAFSKSSNTAIMQCDYLNTTW